VKIPRFRIAWAMGFIALAALDLWAFREMHNVESSSCLVTQVATPMSNVLVVGILIRHRRHGSGFLSGFVVSGAMALAVFVTVASLFPKVLEPHMYWVYRLFFGTIPFPGPSHFRSGEFVLVTNTFKPDYSFARSIWITLPQLAFALIGGLIVRRFMTAERRDQDPR
jgi:hypothetical protein